jgi:hypothetical protein
MLKLWHKKVSQHLVLRLEQKAFDLMLNKSCWIDSKKAQIFFIVFLFFNTLISKLDNKRWQGTHHSF